MPKDNLRWEIQDAIERANEKAKMDKMESELAGGLTVLLAPFILIILMPILAVVVGVGVGFFLPFAILTFAYLSMIRVIGVMAGVFISAILSSVICILDVVAIKLFYQKLKGNWKGRFTIAYMVLALGIPWVAVFFAFSGAPDTRPTPPSTVLEVGESWNYNNISFVLESVDFSSFAIYIDFYIINNTGSDFNFVTDSEDFFTIMDSNGRQYNKGVISGGSWSAPAYGKSYDIGPRIDLDFLTNPEFNNPPVTYLLLRVNGLLGVQNATWRIDIPK
jgi:hypothetical protein